MKEFRHKEPKLNMMKYFISEADDGSYIAKPIEDNLTYEIQVVEDFSESGEIRKKIKFIGEDSDNQYAAYYYIDFKTKYKKLLEDRNFMLYLLEDIVARLSYSSTCYVYEELLERWVNLIAEDYISE